MKPLVNYCRWQRASLRLRGRDAAAVWGELVYNQGGPDERAQEFHYELATRVITLINGDERRSEQLDEMGVVVTSSAPDERK